MMVGAVERGALPGDAFSTIVVFAEPVESNLWKLTKFELFLQAIM
jgi:hypothetical protein